jgi:hypothetical protein
MVQAVGLPPVAGAVGAGTSSGVLEAQLNRYQIQLADWCNCPSGKTPEGKAKIQDLQNKANAVQAQLDRIAAAKAAQASSANQANANPAPGSNDTTTPGISTSATASAKTVGGSLDTFA